MNHLLQNCIDSQKALTAANAEIAELRTQLAAFRIELQQKNAIVAVQGAQLAAALKGRTMSCICGGEAQRDWQPIETAPSTNESILICEGEAVAIGWWNADDELYYTGETRGVYDEPVTYHPTHWMPLPAARAKEKP